MLRRIFGPQRDEVTGEWRKLHNEELNDLHSSSHENPSSGSRVVPRGHVDGQTDRHDEANGCFLQFCELSKKEMFTFLPSMKAEGEVVV